MSTSVENLSRSGGFVKDYWVQRWASGKQIYMWHSHDHRAFLERHNDSMFKKRRKSVFVPLCGKTPDMLWMYHRGHTVVGVDIAKQPVEEFLTDNSIQTDAENIENVDGLYNSSDGRLQLYVSDVFDLDRERCGQFDIIYDCGAFTAINVADRERYRDLLKSLLKPGGHLYVFTCEYDPTIYQGSPYPITVSELKNLFGDSFAIELLEESNFHEFMKTLPDESLSDPITAAIMKSKYMLDRRYKLTLK